MPSRVLALLCLVGCSNPPSSAERTPTGLCSSTTRQPGEDAYVDIVTWFDEKGREVRRVADGYLDDGTWLDTTVTEHGYVDDLLVSYTSETKRSDAAFETSRRLTVYEYDDASRLVTEQTWSGDELRKTTHMTYDELGQAVRVEVLQGDGELTSITENVWSEGRLERWEQRDPEGDVWGFEAYDYLHPSPALDAEKRNQAGEHYVLRYDGEWLIERELLNSYTWGPDTFQWVRRPDGQVELERRMGPDPTWLERSEYDAEGHLVRQETGLDFDEDDVIDESLGEQTWAWSCD